MHPLENNVRVHTSTKEMLKVNVRAIMPNGRAHRRALTYQRSKTPRHQSQAQTAVPCSDLVRHPKVHQSKVSGPLTLGKSAVTTSRSLCRMRTQGINPLSTPNTRKQSASICVHLR